MTSLVTGKVVPDSVVFSDSWVGHDKLDGVHLHNTRGLGLANVVVQRCETRRGWEVTDLITGETYLSPFRLKKGERVEAQLEGARGAEDTHRLLQEDDDGGHAAAGVVHHVQVHQHHLARLAQKGDGISG